MPLSQDQKVEMVRKIRSEEMSGRPEVAAEIRIALTNEEFFLGGDRPVDNFELPRRPPTAGPGSNVKAWRYYAHAVSDFDPEIIDTTKAKDLAKMLAAHGL